MSGCKHAPKAHNNTNYCSDCEPKSEKGCHHGYVWYTCSRCSEERHIKRLSSRVEQLEDENKKLRLALFNYANDQHTGAHASDRARRDVRQSLKQVEVNYIPQHELE